MKKLCTTATALLLTVALLLSGCAEQSNTPAPGDETSTSSEISDSNSFNDSESSTKNSTPDISDISNEQESSTESESNSESVPEESSDITIDPNAVPVEFTDEDRELQKILEELEKGLGAVHIWITCGGPSDGHGGYLTPKYVFIIRGKTKSYYPIPDNFWVGGCVMPTTYDGIKEFVLDYFSERFTDNFIYDCVAKGSMTENADGTFEIKFDENEHEGSLQFIAIDEKIYVNGGVLGGRGLSNMFVDCPTAKIVSRTEDTIEFTYLSGFIRWGELDHRLELSDVELYAKEAYTGVLKYERGGWRRDFDKN